MENALRELLKVQKSISERNQLLWDAEACEKLLFCPIGDLLHVEFYGLPFDESFSDFIGILCSPLVAPAIGSLVFRGPDEGANGTKNWDFSSLIEEETVFVNLRSLVVEPTLPEHHNQTIIAVGYEEEGQIGHLLSLCPALERLEVPSAPNAAFFHRDTHPLTFLRVEAGYDTQDFILNLSRSSCFSQLRFLDFGDYNQRYMEDYPRGCTPIEHYDALFGSQAFSGVKKLVLRNAPLSVQQLREIHERRKDCQFLVLQTPQGEYIR